MLNFKVLSREEWIPEKGNNTVYLKIDHWNDYSFVTSFEISLHDADGAYHQLGDVKVGFKGQSKKVATHEHIDRSFTQLPDCFFSLGASVDYYEKASELETGLKENLLAALRDVIFLPNLVDEIREEEVFSASLLRDTSLATVRGQFTRTLNKQPPLTEFNFKFQRQETEELGSISLEFDVEIESKPSTNIHAIIGRNGIGKTTLLNGMIEAITTLESTQGNFYETGLFARDTPISSEYFASLVSVSFSAFDPFTPPEDQPNPALGTCYYYVGLKNTDGSLKELPEVQEEFVETLLDCFRLEDRKNRWLRAIEKLESDTNFQSMSLASLAQLEKEEVPAEALELIKSLSSGHAVVLLSITKLVAKVEEKTLVLIDEPESHLHPPLLSAFIRALSDLLLDRNGVAIIATHSPVVLQEIPKSCVWKINRIGKETKALRPSVETFGENVGVLTREVFGLEVAKSGFYSVLESDVREGGSYQEILNKYSGQLGLEARSQLMTLVHNRDNALLGESGND